MGAIIPRLVSPTSNYRSSLLMTVVNHFARKLRINQSKVEANHIIFSMHWRSPGIRYSFFGRSEASRKKKGGEVRWTRAVVLRLFPFS